MKTIIFAPHIDDETIGCYQALSKNKIDKVYYFFDLTPERIIEAHNASLLFKFQPCFVTDIDEFEHSFHSHFMTKDLIYVPHINDHHIHHKIVNRLARLNHNNLLFYSIDMNHLAYPVNYAHKKREALYDLYPSQHVYFDSHSESYMFEIIKRNDLRLLKTYKEKFGNLEYSISFNISDGFVDIWNNLKKELHKQINLNDPLEDIIKDIMRFIMKNSFLIDFDISVWREGLIEEVVTLHS